MEDSSFQIENYYELRVAHKMMMAARFCEDPIDLEVPVSPVAAGLHDRIIQKLMAVDIDKGGETAQQEWDEWINISSDTREWAICLKRAKNDLRWLTWNDMEQRFYTMTLFSPFEVSENIFAKFVDEVQLHHLKLQELNKAS